MRILITGASSGLGAEMARQFAAAGHDLALCARRLDRLEDLAAELAPTGVDVAIKPLDVTVDEQVFEVFSAFHDELGGLDRVIINAGLGKGAPLGTGRYQVNRETVMTNFIGALAQTEAAMEIFRAANAGHLVVISSVSALRGMRKTMTAYAASKAAVAHLVEGLRLELHDSPIRFTVIYPGYIESEMTSRNEQNNTLIVSTEKGVKSIVSAIEREVADACVPPLPWSLLAPILKHAPDAVVRRMT